MKPTPDSTGADIGQTPANPIKRNPIIPSMKRRAIWHDYSGKGIYMITLAVEGRKPLLGTLKGVPTPHVELTPLGENIYRHEFSKISIHFPNVKVWKVKIMPDHIHFIIYVHEPFNQGKSLSDVIRGFKIGCSQAYRQLNGRQNLFEEGFNDKILLYPARLESWQRYLDDNPRRLWLKRTRPDLFTVLHNQDIAGTPCEMVGNIFLLDNPEKEAIIIHNCYSETEIRKLHAKWMACGKSGGVLVSAAISRREKAVLREAMNAGMNIILLRDHGFPEFYKPAGESFDACLKGKLLQISPWPHTTQKESITRQKCLFLNSLAEKIATL